eukprot:3058022-Lingulodinium_polyedra.AAC.1
MDQTMNVWRAFNGFEDQTTRCCATDYADTWFSTENSEFNTYYVCLAKTARDWTDMRCKTAI